MPRQFHQHGGYYWNEAEVEATLERVKELEDLLYKKRMVLTDQAIYELATHLRLIIEAYDANSPELSECINNARKNVG